MERRIVYDAPDSGDEAAESRAASKPPGANRLRLAARTRRERGRGSFRYSRGILAGLLQLAPSAIYSAERRGELAVSDLVSVARFIVRRLGRAERRRMRETRRTMSVRKAP